MQGGIFRFEMLENRVEFGRKIKNFSADLDCVGLDSVGVDVFDLERRIKIKKRRIDIKKRRIKIKKWRIKIKTRRIHEELGLEIWDRIIRHRELGSEN